MRPVSPTRNATPLFALSVSISLQYLDFDVSDEDSGRCSFDAMASVLPERVPPLLAEIATVLTWARGAFGPAAASDDDGEWGYDLHAVAEPDTLLTVLFDAGSGKVILEPATGAARTTLTLTLRLARLLRGISDPIQARRLKVAARSNRTAFESH